MDRERFDALARLFATSGSRRAAIGALFGAGLLGASLEAIAKKGKSKGKSRGGGGKGKGNDSGTSRDKDRGKSKSKGKTRKNKARAEQLPANCCSTGNCTPGKGKNLAKCCYEDQNLANAEFKGANVGNANFDNATLTNANFSGANLGKTCFVDADLTGAETKGANLGTAIFCRTTMPDGSINDSGCNKNVRCCPTCIEVDETCGDGIGGECCDLLTCCGTTCTDTQTDEDNCGGCGVTCDVGATCEAGDCVLVVTPGNLRGWRFFNDQIDQPIGSQFESGPDNPPRGDGSAELTVAGPSEGELLSANIFVGAPLADFEILEYTVYVSSATSNTGPSLQLGIDFDGNDGNNNLGFQGRMVYVPSATGAFPQDSWETIDALTDNGTGNWFFTRSSTFGLGNCPASNPCNFSEILGLFPDIRIFPIGPAGTGAGLGFIAFKVGSGEGAVDANVDSIRIKLVGADEPITVYDFEASS